MLNPVFIDGIKELLSYSLILNISGEGGSGKTNLAIHLVSELLCDDESCIWVQASELFPVNRLKQIYEKEKSRKILDQIYLTPKDRPILSFGEQRSIIQNLTNSDTILPPETKIIVIDNISHHLRFEVLSLQSEFERIASIQNRFYEEQLLPLISLCNHNSITLILIHEITYVPSMNKSRNFFYKLYDRIKSISIMLSGQLNARKKKMKISHSDSQKVFSYTIDQKGLRIEH